MATAFPELFNRWAAIAESPCLSTSVVPIKSVQDPIESDLADSTTSPTVRYVYNGEDDMVRLPLEKLRSRISPVEPYLRQCAVPVKRH